MNDICEGQIITRGYTYTVNSWLAGVDLLVNGHVAGRKDSYLQDSADRLVAVVDKCWSRLKTSGGQSYTLGGRLVEVSAETVYCHGELSQH